MRPRYPFVRPQQLRIRCGAYDRLAMEREDEDRDWRPIALASLIVLGVMMVGVIAGLVILGKRGDAVQDSITGLATIGAGLTGGFAGWFARGQSERSHSRRPRSPDSD